MNDHFEEEHTTKSGLDLGLWRRLLPYLAAQKRSILGLCAGGVVVAAIDVALPFTVGQLIDAAASSSREDIPALIGRYLALIGVFSGCIYIFIRAAGVIASGVAHDLRRDGFAHLQRLGFSYYDRRAAGWLMARLTSDIGRIAGLAPWFILDLTWGPLYLLFLSAMMLAIDARIALFVMAIVPTLVVVSLIFQRRLLGTQRRMRRTNSQITAAYNEGIMGVQTTQALAREAEALGEFSGLAERMYKDAVRNGTTAALYLPVVISLGSLGVGLALWRGGVTLGEGLSIGKLINLMTYAAMFSQPIQELAARFTDLQAAQASAERLLSMLDERPVIVDPPAPDPEPCVGGGGPIRSVEFRGVDFAYHRGEPVLAGFELAIRAGESIALVGATGSGKTTIAGLLCRFYEPTAGQVLVDGVDLRERSQHWLQLRLGVVLQHPHLFPGTIRENIRYGRLEATGAEVEDAARLAGAHDFIARLEKGYETEVGEGGSLLSSGERQFVSLARAVLADPAIFVMDEATSSLDTETERRIQEGIDAILAGRISVIIAHRLSTVRRVDRILVIEKGRIIESGSHAELMARRGAYHRLYMAQFARERGREIIEGTSKGADRMTA